MDTPLYDLSIPAISSLQSSLASQATFMQLMSTVFDPKYAFLIYAPLAYLLDPKVGKNLTMTTVVAEWLNMMLKWFLHGERPYWYVHSSGRFNPEETPIKQFPITCELGPGHPSGHAMVTAAVWYIILSSLLKAYQTYQRQQHQDLQLKAIRQAKAATWLLYATLLVLCLAGAALGILTAKWISRQHIESKHFIFASGLLLTTAFGTFALLQVLGFDPSWTIKLATKHCVKREYIHLDTAPFFSVMRYCGFALGCGLGLMFPFHKNSVAHQFVPAATAKGQETPERLVVLDDATKSPFSSSNVSWFSFKLVMALLMARLVDNLGLFVSHSNLTLFYSSAFLAYTLFSYAFVNL